MGTISRYALPSRRTMRSVLSDCYTSAMLQQLKEVDACELHTEF